eukprot:TRINITY_DN2646_c0_g1_i1.p1 TRINITY_DN2646_c0_g1~~TRINITY_DN2646_c0_g1_i1.p1  ORF type:complete len:646 (-),score=156.22 TRINITY_DN2646_c0_g1_i1:13-1950(-)
MSNHHNRGPWKVASKEEPTTSSRLFLGNLASERTTKGELRRIFEKYGKIVEDVVMRKSFGFIQYDNCDSAMRAMKSEQGRLIGGLKLDISLADNREPRKGNGKEPSPPRQTKRRLRTPSPDRRGSSSKKQSSSNASSDREPKVDWSLLPILCQIVYLFPSLRKNAEDVDKRIKSDVGTFDTEVISVDRRDMADALAKAVARGLRYILVLGRPYEDDRVLSLHVIRPGQKPEELQKLSLPATVDIIIQEERIIAQTFQSLISNSNVLNPSVASIPSVASMPSMSVQPSVPMPSTFPQGSQGNGMQGYPQFDGRIGNPMPNSMTPNPISNSMSNPMSNPMSHQMTNPMNQMGSNLHGMAQNGQTSNLNSNLSSQNFNLNSGGMPAMSMQNPNSYNLSNLNQVPMGTSSSNYSGQLEVPMGNSGSQAYSPTSNSYVNYNSSQYGSQSSQYPSQNSQTSQYSPLNSQYGSQSSQYPSQGLQNPANLFSKDTFQLLGKILPSSQSSQSSQYGSQNSQHSSQTSLTNPMNPMASSQMSSMMSNPMGNGMSYPSPSMGSNSMASSNGVGLSQAYVPQNANPMTSMSNPMSGSDDKFNYMRNKGMSDHQFPMGNSNLNFNLNSQMNEPYVPGYVPEPSQRKVHVQWNPSTLSL